MGRTNLNSTEPVAEPSTLESLAELVPEEHRERFFAIARKFRTVPEDDDHLQMLEAVGFMMLVMDEVPARIAAILAGAKRQIGEEEGDQLRSEIVAALTESLDTPSYKDLRQTMASIRDNEDRFRRRVDDLHRSLSRTAKAVRGSTLALSGLWTGLVGGGTAAIAVAALITFAPELSSLSEDESTAKVSASWNALQKQGMLDFVEVDQPSLGGRVGVFTISGDVRAAFMEGDQGIVAVGLTDSSR